MNGMIKEIRVVGNIAVITATAEFHPLRQLYKVSKALTSFNFRGEVLFDLLAVNGLADNRFINIYFDGNKFDRKSFAIECNVNPSVLKEQNNIARSDSRFLNGTVLSAAEKEAFLH